MLLAVDKTIAALKRRTTELFGHVQGVNFSTLKFHSLGHNVENISRAGDLAYLYMSPSKPFISDINKFTSFTLMRNETKIEEAERVINTTDTVPEHIATQSFGNGRNLLSRDGRRVSLNTLLTTTFSIMTHIKRDGRTELASYIKKTLLETSKASGAIPIQSQIVLKVVKARYICSNTNPTLKN